MQARNIPLDHVCLLDPKAPTALSPSDGGASGKFSWFLFGVAFLPFLPPFFWAAYHRLHHSFFFLVLILLSVRVSSVQFPLRSLDGLGVDGLFSLR
jgi:hypothetical protein